VPGPVNYPHPIVAREGWPYLGASIALAAAVTWFAGWLWAAPLWVWTLFVLQFFRDPPRQAPGDARTVVAPADGRIVAVGAAYDPYLKRDTLKVSIFMNVFNAHSNRSPVDGEVRERWYHEGTFVNASLDKACLENERNALWIRAAAGADVTCVQVAGLIARRILCYVDRGDALARGQRFGFIRFGSRVDVYLPKTATVKAALGDKVHAATSILAVLSDHG
jgi:phosphatidylserine decarboxylase